MKRKPAYLATLAFLLTLSAFSAFTPSVLAQNTPPVADAGPDQTIFRGESTVLQGSATDPDGDDIVMWQWTIESGPAGGFLSARYHPEPLFIPGLSGDYVLSLVATDGIDWSEPDYVTIHVIENLPPVAIATADVTSGPAPLTVNFDGSQSYDPEGDALLYYWRFGDGGIPSIEPLASHTYLLVATYAACLTVVDSFGQSDTEIIMIITVFPEPTPESAIEDLIADVEGMNLQQGLDNSLDAKLSAALDALEALNAGQRNDAVNKLNALMNEVEAQRGKKLTNEQADYLIAEVQAIIDLIA